MMTTQSPIIVALDYADKAQAIAFAKQCSPTDVRLKVGKELFVSAGPDVVKALQDLGFEIFLDLKFHDIPNTVANACLAAARLGVWMLNVHASGGEKMMQTAQHRLLENGFTADAPYLIAVTVLTSADDTLLPSLGITKNTQEQVLHLATMTQHSGLSGVVCSAHEAAAIKAALGADFLTITPGIRLAEDAQDDQSRIMTPKLARANGADYLVIGRPITQAKSPKQKIETILESLTLDD